jgi:hypothetical protein
LEAALTQILGDRDFFNIFSSRIDFMIDYRAYSTRNSMIDSRTNKDHQVILFK